MDPPIRCRVCSRSCGHGRRDRDGRPRERPRRSAGKRAAGTSPGGASLVDDVAAVVPALTAVAGYVVAHPARACALLSGAAFVAVTGAGVVGRALTGQASAVIGAGATGVFETAAIVVAYLTLGRTLGIRPPRGARAITLE